MKKILALVCTLCLLLTALPLTALAADDDWVTLNVEMYDRSIAGFNVEDCWQLHYIQENFGDPNHIKINWIPVSRWEEGTILSTRLAGGTAPDICMTYGTDLVQQYIDMGGIMPLDDLLAEYGQELTAFVGERCFSTVSTTWATARSSITCLRAASSSQRRACSSARTGWKSWAWKFPRTWKSCMPT